MRDISLKRGNSSCIYGTLRLGEQCDWCEPTIPRESRLTVLCNVTRIVRILRGKRACPNRTIAVRYDGWSSNRAKSISGTILVFTERSSSATMIMINDDNDPFSEMKKRNSGACVRSFDRVNVESHKRYSAWMCVRVYVWVCLFFLRVCMQCIRVYVCIYFVCHVWYYIHICASSSLENNASAWVNKRNVYEDSVLWALRRYSLCWMCVFHTQIQLLWVTLHARGLHCGDVSSKSFSLRPSLFRFILLSSKKCSR